MVRRRPSQRREPVAASQAALREPGGEPRRAAVELGVGQLAAEEADRDAVGREARAVGEPAPDRQLAASHASSRNAETDETNRSGASQKKRWPVPGNALEARIGKELDEQVGVPRVDDDVLVAVLDERRRRERSEPAVGVEGRAGRCLRGPRGRLLRRLEPVRHDPVDELRMPATVAGASAFSTNRRSATAGSSVAASAMSASV